MKYLKLAVLLCALFVSSCSKNKEVQARKDLEAMGIRFDVKSFQQSILKKDCTAVKLFLDAKMSPNIAMDSGLQPLSVAIVMSLGIGINIDLVKILIDGGADVNLSSSMFGRGSAFYETLGNRLSTPLMMAINRSDVKIVQLLVSKGADVNKTTADPEGVSPLLLSARRDSLEITQILIDNGAKLNPGELNSLEAEEAKKANSGRADIIALLKKAGAK